MSETIPPDIFPIMVGYDPREKINEARRAGSTVVVVGLPWAMIDPHEPQAKLNHGGQTLRRLAERGGLSAAEAVAVMRDEPYRAMSFAAAQFRLAAMVAHHTLQVSRDEAEDEFRATGGF